MFCLFHLRSLNRLFDFLFQSYHSRIFLSSYLDTYLYIFLQYFVCAMYMRIHIVERDQAAEPLDVDVCCRLGGCRWSMIRDKRRHRSGVLSRGHALPSAFDYHLQANGCVPDLCQSRSWTHLHKGLVGAIVRRPLFSGLNRC